jgi:sec-independent protein translocase protein TatA
MGLRTASLGRTVKQYGGDTVPNLGFGELVIVFLIVMLIFGAGRLPQIGEGLGKAIRNLKRGLNTDDDIDITPVEKQVPNQAASRVDEAEVVDKAETK